MVKGKCFVGGGMYVTEELCAGWSEVREFWGTREGGCLLNAERKSANSLTLRQCRFSSQRKQSPSKYPDELPQARPTPHTTPPSSSLTDAAKYVKGRKVSRDAGAACSPFNIYLLILTNNLLSHHFI